MDAYKELYVQFRYIVHKNHLLRKLQLYIFIHKYCLKDLSKRSVFTLVTSTCKELMPCIGRDMALTVKVTQLFTKCCILTGNMQ